MVYGNLKRQPEINVICAHKKSSHIIIPHLYKEALRTTTDDNRRTKRRKMATTGDRLKNDAKIDRVRAIYIL